MVFKANDKHKPTSWNDVCNKRECRIYMYKSFLQELLEAGVAIIMSRILLKKKIISVDTFRFAVFIAMIMLALDFFDRSMKSYVRTGLYCNIGTSMNTRISAF